MVETWNEDISLETNEQDFLRISADDLYYYLQDLPASDFRNDHVWERSLHTVNCVQMPSSGLSIVMEEGTDYSHSPIEREQKAKFSLQSMAGREVTFIFTDLLRDHLSHDQTKLFKCVESVTKSRSNLKDEEKTIFEIALDKVTKGKKFLLRDLPQVSFDVWKNIKPFYVFDSDQQINSNSFAWNLHLSREQLAVEEAIIGIHSLKIKKFLEQDLFDTQRIFLPLESNPVYKLESKTPFRFQVYYKDFGIQHLGQSDWVLHHRHGLQSQKVVIQQKYIPTTDLYSDENRLKILIHSLGVKGTTGKSWSHADLNPTGVTYLHQVYDYENAEYYYVDLSIKPAEFPALLDKLEEYSKKWVDNKELYRGELKRRKQEVVLPKLKMPVNV